MRGFRINYSDIDQTMEWVKYAAWAIVAVHVLGFTIQQIYKAVRRSRR